MKNNVYTWVSLVFFILIIGFAISIAAYLIWLKKKNDPARLKTEIHSYKYGKFLWVYILAIPLFIMAFAYEGRSVGNCIFAALTDALKLAGLQFDLTLQLTTDNLMFRIAIYGAYSVATLNLILFVASFVSQLVSTGITKIKIWNNKKTKCLILGNTDTSKVLYNSNLKHTQCILDVMNKDQKWALYTKGIKYISKSSRSQLKKYLTDLIEASAKHNAKAEINKCRKTEIFINFASDQLNIEYCSFLSEVLKKIIDEDKDSKKYNGKVNSAILPYINIYTYISNQYTSVYEGYVKSLKGCLHLIDKESIIAFDFVNRYPVASNMNQNQIDFNTSCLKPDVDVSINFLGFGKSSQQLFMSLFANSQFVNKTKDGIKIHPVEFNLFDKSQKDNNKLLNNAFNRYWKKVALNKGFKHDSYLPTPELNNVNTFFGAATGDINMLEVKENFYKKLENPSGKNVNYVIISLGDDFESIDIAKKIYDKLHASNNLYKNCYIYVRVSDNNACESSVKAINIENKYSKLVPLNFEQDKQFFAQLYKTLSNDNDFKFDKEKSTLNKTIGYYKEKVTVAFEYDEENNMKNVYSEGPVELNREFNFKYCQVKLTNTVSRYVYGSWSETSYNYDSIVKNEISKLGILQGIQYLATNNIGAINQRLLVLDPSQDIVESNRAEWTSKDEYNRYSDINAALHLRSKLLQMGLDYVAINDATPAAFEGYEGYWEYLAGNDKPQLNGSSLDLAKDNKGNFVIAKIDGKPQPTKLVSAYESRDYVNGQDCLSLKYKPNNQNKESRRWTLVNLEHNRWNAFMITYGYVPCTKAQITTLDRCKDVENKLHGCLTTMDGLVQIQNMLYEKAVGKKKVTEQDKLKLLSKFDKINFDYLQFDIAWHTLNKIGCKIVYSKNNNQYMKGK